MSLIFDDIKYFVVISKTLNITRASEIIGVSQPALSYSVKRLENQLGGELLIRYKNGIQLTKLGENFKQHSNILLHEWTQVQNLVSSDAGIIQGTYSFALHPSVALYTLEQFLPELQNNIPEINLNFTHGISRRMTEKVINWEADFGIVVNPIKHLDLVIKKLFTDEVAIFYSENTKDKLILDKRLAQSRYLMGEINKIANFSSMINSGNLEVVAKLTSLGFGYGILPTRIAAQYNNLKRLKSSPIFNDEICLIYRPEKHNNPISQKIIKIISSSLNVDDK